MGFTVENVEFRVYHNLNVSVSNNVEQMRTVSSNCVLSTSSTCNGKEREGQQNGV